MAARDHVLIYGNPIDGLTLMGPIDVNDPAVETYVETELSGVEWWYAPITPLVDDADSDTWADHDDWTRWDWFQEVASDSTRSGYLDWRAHKIEEAHDEALMAEIRRKPVDGLGVPYGRADADHLGYHTICPICGDKFYARIGTEFGGRYQAEDAITKSSAKNYAEHYTAKHGGT